MLNLFFKRTKKSQPTLTFETNNSDHGPETNPIKKYINLKNLPNKKK